MSDIDEVDLNVKVDDPRSDDEINIEIATIRGIPVFYLEYEGKKFVVPSYTNDYKSSRSLIAEMRDAGIWTCVSFNLDGSCTVDIFDDNQPFDEYPEVTEKTEFRAVAVAYLYWQEMRKKK
jgi:hypothetical protein